MMTVGMVVVVVVVPMTMMMVVAVRLIICLYINHIQYNFITATGSAYSVRNCERCSGRQWSIVPVPSQSKHFLECKGVCGRSHAPTISRVMH
jgi:hypothetical protein